MNISAIKEKAEIIGAVANAAQAVAGAAFAGGLAIYVAGTTLNDRRKERADKKAAAKIDVNDPDIVEGTIVEDQD